MYICIKVCPHCSNQWDQLLYIAHSYCQLCCNPGIPVYPWQVTVCIFTCRALCITVKITVSVTINQTKSNQFKIHLQKEILILGHACFISSYKTLWIGDLIGKPGHMRACYQNYSVQTTEKSLQKHRA